MGHFVQWTLLYWVITKRFGIFNILQAYHELAAVVNGFSWYYAYVGYNVCPEKIDPLKKKK